MTLLIVVTTKSKDVPKYPFGPQVSVVNRLHKYISASSLKYCYDKLQQKGLLVSNVTRGFFKVAPLCYFRSVISRKLPLLVFDVNINNRDRSIFKKFHLD